MDMRLRRNCPTLLGYYSKTSIACFFCDRKREEKKDQEVESTIAGIWG